MATTKKKNVFEEKPFTSGGTPAPEKNVSGQTKGITIPGFNPLMPGQTPTMGQSKADVPPPTTDKNTSNKPKFIPEGTDRKTYTVRFPDGKEYTNLDPNVAFDLYKSYRPSTEKTSEEESMDKARQLQQQELISQIGQVSPEQQALVAQNIAQPTARVGFGDVIRTAGERAAIAGASGAITGAVGGSVLPGLGTLAGAGALGTIAGVTAGATAFFTAYKKADKANYETAATNYDTARANMNQAIEQINKGLGYQSDLQALKKYNEALVQIDLSESQLKELARDKNKYKAEIRSKLTEIQDFRQYDRQQLDFYMQGGIQKPSANYINNSMTQV